MSNNRIVDIARFARVFRALANDHRVKIFTRLASCCAGEESCCLDEDTSACVGEIAQDLELAPSTVSHHIKELNHAGLIKMERQGQSIRCWVEPKIVQELRDFFGELAEARSEISATPKSNVNQVGGNK